MRSLLTRRTRIAVAVAVALSLALASACTDDEGASDDGTTTTTTTVTSTSSMPPTTGAPSTTEAPREVEVAAYLLRDGFVGPVGRTAASPDRVARDAVEGLLTGPTDEEAGWGLTTAIPDGTALVDLAIADGVATVDLSAEFATAGDPTSVEQRVAQVVFTLTRFDSVDAVTFRIDGAPVDAIAGLALDPPVDRADLEPATPQILLESPLPGAAVTDPLELRGWSTTFEGTIRVAVLDADGTTVHDGFFNGQGANGIWGPFETSIDLLGASSGLGEVHLWQDDMSGELPDPRVDLVVVPIVLP